MLTNPFIELRRAALAVPLAATLVFMPGELHAQLVPDEAQWRPMAEAALDECLSDPERSDASCIGTVSQACPDLNVDTASQVRCGEAELEAWQGRLDQAYDDLRISLELEDALVDGSDPYKLAVAIENVQSVWEDWRDAQCGFSYAKYRGGSLGRVDRIYCLGRMTAERYFDITGLLDESG